jgi:sulfotransferase
MKLNVVTGMPRSGSTLLCNILNQHPDVHASSTSPVCEMVSALAQGMATQPEITSEVINGNNNRIIDAERGTIEGWYKNQNKGCVFDKGRGWSTQAALLRRLYPESLIVCVYRNPADVFASIEARDEETAELQPMPGTMAERASTMISNKGIIGASILAVEDLKRRAAENVLFVDYDNLCKHPDKTLQHIGLGAKLATFTYDFDNVQSTATDIDPLYHNKFPHDDATGKVEVRPKRKLPDDVVKHIMAQYPYFNREMRFQG